MPHIIVKLFAGRSEARKKNLTQNIVKSVMEATDCSEEVVSVAFEEFEPGKWAETVYKKDILNGPGKLYKAPGYDPFAEKEDKEKEDDKREDKPDLMAYVRGASEQAAKEDTGGIFNPMSWLDIELEDNPHTFDTFFDTPWNQLSDNERGERMAAIRKVL